MATPDTIVEKTVDDVKDENDPVSNEKTSSGTAASEDPETDQGGSASTESEMTEPVAESKEKESENVNTEEEIEKDQKTDENQKSNSEASSAPEDEKIAQSDEYAIKQDIKESESCSVTVIETETSTNDQNHQQGKSSIDNNETSSENQDEILSSEKEDGNCSESQEVTSRDTQEETSLNSLSEEITSPNTQTTLPCNEEVIPHTETSSVIPTQKIGAEDETSDNVTEVIEEIKSALPQKQEEESIVTQEEACTEKDNDSSIEKDIKEEESDLKTLDTEDENKQEEKIEATNSDTSAVGTEKGTEQTTSETQTVGDGEKSDDEMKNSKESDLPQEEIKSQRPSRQRSTSSKTVLESKGQGHIKPDIQTEPLALVTKPIHEVKAPSMQDEKSASPFSTENSAILVGKSSDGQSVEEYTSDAELNTSDTSMLDDSVSTDCSNLSTQDRYSRGSGLYRAYKCKGCKYSTPIKTNLRRHASINIEYKPFLCNLCGGKFTDKSTLNFHNKKRHSGSENFEYTPEDEKDKALDKYLDMCINLEGKVKSTEVALRNPSKYKDCNLVTFDMFNHFKNTASKKFTKKKEINSSVDGDGENDSAQSLSDKKKSRIMKTPQTKEQVFVTYPDGSMVEAGRDGPESSPAEPRRRGPGRKRKNELGSYPVGSNTENTPQINTSNISINSPMINPRSQTPLLAVRHPGSVMPAQGAAPAGSINLIQTFGGIAIPVPMQMPMPIPIQVPAQMPTQLSSQMSLQPQTPDQPQMTSPVSHSQPSVIDSNPTRQLIENEDKKKKGRTKTIREILNLDNGVRRQKLSHGQIAEAKANTAGGAKLSFRLKSGRGQGRRRESPRSFDLETDQSSTDNSVPESEVSGSEGDPSWPEPVQKRRGRTAARGHGIAPLKRKYMRMKLVGTLPEQYVMKSKRGSNVSVNTQSEEKFVGAKKKKTESDLKEEGNASAEMDVSSEKKTLGRKRKIDCVSEPTTRGLEKQRKMASETGILTEETINNSLLALKRRQDNITATSTRVKRKYVKRTKSLTMPPKKNKSRATSNNESALLSISSTSSTLEEQRDLNETGMSATAVQSPEKRKRGRPTSSKKTNLPKIYVRGPYKKKPKIVPQEPVSVNEQKTIIHSGCDKCPLEEVSVDGKRKRINVNPGKANCLCETGGSDGENVEISRTSVKKPTLLKSARMTNYVKKYSQKYSKLAKAKSQVKGQQMIKCPLCEYQSKSINGVRLHAFWVHKMCKYSCTECSYFTLNRYEGLAHYKEEHPGKTVALVRSFCLLKDLEEDTTPGHEGKVLTLSLHAQTSPSKQPTPSKTDIYDYNESGESSPSKSHGAPDITNTAKTPVTEDRAKVLKGRCPKCSYVSTVRGVGQHLMLAHDTVNWVCKECKYKSHSKTLAFQHARRNHKGMQPKVYRMAILVKPDPELNLEILPKASSTPKSSKGSIEADTNLSDLSPTMPKLKKFPKTWQMKLGSIKDRENLQQLIAKRKGKTGKAKITETTVEESSASYTLHPRKMESLKVGFSCVYCYYAAPLRHQLHLHCYDKHTNHPACLMKFTKDTTVLDFLGDSAHVKVADKGKLPKSDFFKKETVLDKERVQRIIKWNNDQASEVKDKICEKGEITKKGDNCLETKNQNEELPMKEMSFKECGVVNDPNYSVHSVKPQKVTLSHSVTDNMADVAANTACPSSKQLTSNKLASSKPFLNPLTPLVTSLGASQVKLHDTFHSSLDDLDTILSNFGVRTLNMDMLTRKQFTDFIHRYGNSLQQM